LGIIPNKQARLPREWLAKPMIAKYCNQHQHEAPNYEVLEHNINALRERLNDIWKRI